MNQRINYVSTVIIDSLNQRLMYLMLQYVHTDWRICFVL